MDNPQLPPKFERNNEPIPDEASPVERWLNIIGAICALGLLISFGIAMFTGDYDLCDDEYNCAWDQMTQMVLAGGLLVPGLVLGVVAMMNSMAGDNDLPRTNYLCACNAIGIAYTLMVLSMVIFGWSG